MILLAKFCLFARGCDGGILLIRGLFCLREGGLYLKCSWRLYFRLPIGAYNTEVPAGVDGDENAVRSDMPFQDVDGRDRPFE